MRFRLFPKEDGWIPHLWLIFFYYSFTFIVQMRGIDIVLFALPFILFFILYREMYWRPQRAFLNTIGMTISVSVMVFFFDSSYIFLMLYVAHLLSFIKIEWKYWTAYTVQNSLLVLMLYTDYQGFTNFYWPILAPAWMWALAAPIINRIERNWYRKWNETKQELQVANQQIETLIKQQERDRIARDLHDAVGQTLSTISVKSDISSRLLFDKPELVKKEIEDIQAIARQLLHEMRAIVTDLKSVSLAEELKTAELRLAEAGIRAETIKNATILDPLTDHILGYCLKEAVTNIIRHSNANKCWITFAEKEGNLQLIIADNGTTAGDNIIFGNGLQGMKERLALHNGTMRFQYAPDSVSLLIGLPLSKQREDMQYDSYSVSG